MTAAKVNAQWQTWWAEALTVPPDPAVERLAKYLLAQLAAYDAVIKAAPPPWQKR